MPICAFDPIKLVVEQTPRLGMRTKNDTAARTVLLPIPFLLEIVMRWDEYVRENLPPEAAWYAVLSNHWGEQTLTADEPGDNRHITLNRRLRRLWKRVGLPHKSPHAFRRGHARLWHAQSKDMNDIDALRRNLMQEDIRTTIAYSQVPGDDLPDIASGLFADENSIQSKEANDTRDLAEEVVMRLMKELQEINILAPKEENDEDQIDPTDEDMDEELNDQESSD